MKQLTVELSYAAADFGQSNSGFSAPLTLPLRVLDVEGSLLATSGVNSKQPARLAFELPVNQDAAFVRLTWPSGKSQTQRVDFNRRNKAEISFTDSSISSNEWTAWAVPRLSPHSAMVQQRRPEAAESIQKYSKVWLCLWQFVNQQWVRTSRLPTNQYANDYAKQLDFQLDPTPWLLQIGGSRVPWRFVALPGGGPARVLLTPRESSDPRADPLEVIVTGFRADAETLLEFLSRDALRSATSMVSFQPIATRLLEHKTDDPIAAIAGSYFLLRTQGWQSIPDHWFDNLLRLFDWIPDAAIIRCTVNLRKGIRNSQDMRRTQELLASSMEKGLPIFSEGVQLLQEAAAMLGQVPSYPNLNAENLSSRIGKLKRATAWAGSALSFYGITPDEPSPKKQVGGADRPRPMRGPSPVSRASEQQFSVLSDDDGLQVKSLSLPSQSSAPRFRTAAKAMAAKASGPNALAVTSGMLYLGDIGKK